jgi:hypothetical protein
MLEGTIEQELLLTTAEAVALVKRSERERGSWALHVRADARIKDDPEHVFRDGLAHYLTLSRADALQLVSKWMSPKTEEKGGRILVKRIQAPSGKGFRVTYWIGG